MINESLWIGSLIVSFIIVIVAYRLFGKTGILQYLQSGDFKYVIRSDNKYIYSLIIQDSDSQEEARRLIDLISEQVEEMEDFSILEGIVTQILNIDPSYYILRKGFT